MDFCYRRRKRTIRDVECESDVFGLGPAPESAPKREVPIDTGMYELSRSYVNAHVIPGCHGNDLDKNKRGQTQAEKLENTDKDAHLSRENNSESPVLGRKQNGFPPLTGQDINLTQTKNVISERGRDDVTRETDCYGNNLTEPQTVSKDDVIHGETVISSSSEWTKL